MEIKIVRRSGEVLTALVDDADADIAAGYTWFATTPRHPGETPYARANLKVDGRWTNIKMHTLLTGWPLVDHINGNGLDNRRENLRAATPELNMANRRPNRRNATGYKGVRKVYRRYVAKIAGSELGRFDTAEEAARAYDVAALEKWGEFARPNFPR